MEKSYVWGGTSIGDAIYSTYDETEWSTIWGSLFCYNRYEDGVFPLSTRLAVTNPAGTTLRMAYGAALVDGTVYINDADLDFSTYGDGTYHLSLVKYWASKTVRAYLTKGGEGIFGGVDGSYWGINIAEITVSSGVHTITDMRKFIKAYPQLFGRKGGSATDWGVTAGSTNYSAYNAMTQLGSHSITLTAGNFDGNRVITFPRAYSAVPVVSVSLRNSEYANVTHLEALPTTSYVSVTVKRSGSTDTATIYFSWIAIGPG